MTKQQTIDWQRKFGARVAIQNAERARMVKRLADEARRVREALNRGRVFGTLG